MPSYTYFCEKKHEEFEVFHSIKDKLEECPHCAAEGDKGVPVERLISGAANFHLKSGGVGWYKNGYSK